MNGKKSLLILSLLYVIVSEIQCKQILLQLAHSKLYLTSLPVNNVNFASLKGGNTEGGHSSDQLWRYDSTSQMLHHQQGLCLDAYQPTNGGDVHLYKCDPSNRNQLWQYNEETKLFQHVSHRGFCLDGDLNQHKKGVVQLWQCNSHNKHQMWYIINATRSNKQCQVNLMSFNIRYPSPIDGGNIWPYRKELVYQIFRNHQPHVVGTQEGLAYQLGSISANVGSQYASFGKPRKALEEYMKIFYDKNRLSFVRGGDFWLSETPDVAGSHSWGSAYVRMATWVQLELKACDKKKFYVFNTHFDHQSQLARNEGTKVLLLQIKHITKPNDVVFVMGDFNSYRDDTPFQILTQDFFDDTHIKAKHQIGQQVCNTFHGFNGLKTETGDPNLFGKKHIDFIMSHPKNTRVDSFEVVTDSKHGRYPSDHYPVQAQVRL